MYKWSCICKLSFCCNLDIYLRQFSVLNLVQMGMIKLRKEFAYLWILNLGPLIYKILLSQNLGIVRVSNKL